MKLNINSTHAVITMMTFVPPDIIWKHPTTRDGVPGINLDWFATSANTTTSACEMVVNKLAEA
jgi:hypothetical protein